MSENNLVHQEPCVHRFAGVKQKKSHLPWKNLSILKVYEFISFKQMKQDNMLSQLGSWVAFPLFLREKVTWLDGITFLG